MVYNLMDVRQDCIFMLLAINGPMFKFEYLLLLDTIFLVDPIGSQYIRGFYTGYICVSEINQNQI